MRIMEVHKKNARDWDFFQAQESKTRTE